MNAIEANIKEFSYINSMSRILKNINLTIKAGELVVITGLSGCGKTTLTRILNGLIPSHYDGVLNGEVKILGKNILDYESGEIAKFIGNVFQNPTDQFFANVVEDEIAFIGENLGMPIEELRKKIDRSLKTMGIEGLKYAKINSLSGGQKQKVAIASTLVYDTKIIFFDEPSSNLDYEGIVQFKEILEQLKKAGKTIIVSEHRLFFLKDLYDRILYMKEGHIQQEFKKGELTESDCKNYSLRSIDYNELCSENKLITNNKKEYFKDVTIQVGKNKLIDNLNFDLFENEVMAIVGKNGIGKTTLGRSLSGILKLKGEVSYGNSRKQRLKNSYYMMQDVDYQIFFDTVENEILESNFSRDEEYLDYLRDKLTSVDLITFKNEHPQNLSGGQKQRLALLTACLSNRRVIILDEPTSGLDYKRMNEISMLIKEFSMKNPIIIITHDIELIFKACNTALMIDEETIRKVNVSENENKILHFLTKK